MTQAKEVFKPMPIGAYYVFGSNLSGIHGGGVALEAFQKYNAKWGFGHGLTGQAYALPTKDEVIETLPIERVQGYVDTFKQFASDNADKVFYVTKIGCGLAGFTEDQIAPMFKGSPANCILPYGWDE